ncbi:sensor histidine kinase [Alloscardovia criceti]|uniref:sensor histidine kinase n=1 Tax=Alloscardovia criceti TaxID=356828 RepID=UPI00037C77BD|nr:HAMP domain-containing sensor histidine kinase [Alloscardovia criceti]
MANTAEKPSFLRHLKYKLSAIPLASRLVALVLIVLVLASSVLVFASRQLVSSALLQKTDTQLMRQATLVINNIDLLQSENKVDQAPSSQGLSGSTTLGNLIGNVANGAQNSNSSDQNQRPMPYSTTGNQNLGPADYFVQIRDSNNDILSTPLVPIAHDGIESIPTLPEEGTALSFPYNTPTTVAATVTTADNITLNERTSKMAYTPWRVIAMQYMNRSTGTQYVVYIALSLFDVNDTTQALTMYFVWAATAIVISAGLLAFIAIRRSLRPLKYMEKTAAKIAAGDLSQRVQTAPPNTEIGSLSASLNTMLSRIERSFKKQEEITNQMKRFVSDASHELRTPLAVIHGSTELYKMQRKSPYTDPVESADMVIEHIDKSSSRMSALVEDLLSLARLDEGRGIDLAQTIHVKTLLEDSAEDLHALDPEREIRLGRLSMNAGSILQSVTGEELSENSDPLVFVPGQIPEIDAGGDPVRLRQVVTNIIGNIHRYTPHNSPVEVGASVVHASVDPRDFENAPSTSESLYRFLDMVSQNSQRNDSLEFVIIRIIDHGPGMDEESRQRIFERFYTADPSRAREKGGTGLGMSIAQSVINAHHGIICATPTPDGGLTFTVVIPISQTMLFRTVDPAEEHLREKKTAPAIFGKRKRNASDDMTTTQIEISLNSKKNTSPEK